MGRYSAPRTSGRSGGLPSPVLAIVAALRHFGACGQPPPQEAEEGMLVRVARCLALAPRYPVRWRPLIAKLDEE